MNLLYGLTIALLFCNLYFIVLGGEWSWGRWWVCAEWHSWRHICVSLQHPREWKLFHYEEFWYDGPRKLAQIGPFGLSWDLE